MNLFRINATITQQRDDEEPYDSAAPVPTFFVEAACDDQAAAAAAEIVRAAQGELLDVCDDVIVTATLLVSPLVSPLADADAETTFVVDVRSLEVAAA